MGTNHLKDSQGVVIIKFLTPLEKGNVGDKKMIKNDRHIADFIKSMHKDWTKLEREHRKPARASKSYFMSNF